jgi:hypothetical protein
MTYLYNQTGQVQLFCDTCFTKTDFFDTLAELLAAVHYNRPLTEDGAGWTDGVGRQVTGPGFQLVAQIDSTKAICPRCRGFFETAAYRSDFVVKKQGKIGKIGEPAKTSAAEDAQLDAPVKPAFRGTVSKFPRVFPKNEPEFSNDSQYTPYGEQGEAGTG